MSKKRIIPIVLCVCAVFLLSACGSRQTGTGALDGAAAPVDAGTTAVETTAAESTAGQSARDVQEPAARRAAKAAGGGTSGAQETMAEKQDFDDIKAEKIEEAPDGAQGPGGGREEAVKETAAQTVSAFAERVQEACADQDLTALAGLLTYPCRILFADGSEQQIGSPEGLLSIGPSRIFTDALLVSIAKVDTASLSIEDGRVEMGEGDSHMIFQVTQDKNTGISEICLSDGA